MGCIVKSRYIFGNDALSRYFSFLLAIGLSIAMGKVKIFCFDV